jgi:curved DNA-binding protein
MPGGGRFTYRRVDPSDLGDMGDFSDFFRTFFAGGSEFGFGGLGQTPAGARGDSARSSRATRAPVAEAETEVTLAELVSGAERMVSVDGRRLQVKIPPGVSDGSRVRIPGAGLRGDGGAPGGDLVITVRVRPDPRFERRGADLVTTVPLSLQEALLGAEVPVPTPTGSVRLRIRPGTQPGQEIRLAGRGLPRRGNGRGDLIVVARVVLPTLDEQGRDGFARFAREHPQPDPRGETTVH